MPTTEFAVEALIGLRLQSGKISADQFWILIERFRADLINQARTIDSRVGKEAATAKNVLCAKFCALLFGLFGRGFRYARIISRRPTSLQLRSATPSKRPLLS